MRSNIYNHYAAIKGRIPVVEINEKNVDDDNCRGAFLKSYSTCKSEVMAPGRSLGADIPGAAMKK